MSSYLSKGVTKRSNFGEKNDESLELLDMEDRDDAIEHFNDSFQLVFQKLSKHVYESEAMK